MLHLRIRLFLFFVLLGMALLEGVAAFTIGPSSAPIVPQGLHKVGVPSSRQNSRNANRMSSLLYMAKDSPEKKKKEYTPVEDGSPLGVAIVLSGLVLYNLFGDQLATVENYLPIVAVTASTAAGISRLVRNSGQKEEEDSF